VNALSRFLASENLFGTSILNWNEVEMPGNLEIAFGIARHQNKMFVVKLSKITTMLLTEQELGETAISLDTSKE
jgi:hypothetical protein